MTDYLVIFGSRSGVPESVVRDYVYSLPLDTVVITGGEFGKKGAPIETLTGVDWFATKAALERGMAVEVYPAQWDAYRTERDPHGRPAGPIRNALLVKYGTRGYGFRRWGGVSKGADDCHAKFSRARKRVWVETDIMWAA